MGKGVTLTADEVQELMENVEHSQVNIISQQLLNYILDLPYEM